MPDSCLLIEPSTAGTRAGGRQWCLASKVSRWRHDALKYRNPRDTRMTVPQVGTPVRDRAISNVRIPPAPVVV
jgi:hypothetical protein